MKDHLHIAPVKNCVGELILPGDKSISHRALMLGSLFTTPLIVSNCLAAEDIVHLKSALRFLGTLIEDGEQISVHTPVWRAPKQALYVGNSGTSCRLLTGMLAGLGMTATITGDESLNQRPMQRIIAPLSYMGAQIFSDSGKCPLIIEPSQLQGIEYELPVASAQVKSSILLAAVAAKVMVAIKEPVPTRDHTERMLTAMGANLSFQDQTIIVKPSTLQPTPICVPGDISSAAFFMVLASVVKDACWLLKDVGINPLRTGVIDALKLMGADIQLSNQRLFGTEPVADILIRHAPLKGIDFPTQWVTRTIDELPILFVAACFAKGKSIFRSAKELRVKESDRIGAMADALTQAGIQIEEFNDGMMINPSRIQYAKVDARGDHRIAMAMSVAFLAACGGEIVNSVNIQTSFPSFIDIINTHCGQVIQ